MAQRGTRATASDASLLDKLGVDIDPELLSLALTHRSWAYENGQGPHNERLEFLGDAVINPSRLLFGRIGVLSPSPPKT